MRRIHDTFFRLVLLVLALGGSALPLAAQSRTTTAVRGTVTNQAGEPLASAVVTVRQEETGALKRVATNAEGRYLVLQLQPGGPYTLLVQSLGYADASLQDIHLQVGDVVTLDVRLQEQAIEVEGIEVNAERAEIFNPSQVGPATRMDERVVESVPILSRNLMELAVLSPLVKTTEGGGFSVAGQNDRYNSILIDGVSSKDVFGLTAGGVPGGQAGAKLIPLDAVAQYEVLVAPFDVRLSGFTGGVMNAVTKTGTNQWNARAFGAYRAEALIGDLSLPTGPVEASGVDRTLLGLSVGGPIIQDRAHFFVSGEFERRKQPPTGYNLLRDDPLLVRLSPEAVGDFSDELANQFGLETGIAGPYPLKQELANVFGRVDWTLANGQRMTVRNVFAYASNDESPNRFAFEPYGLSSNAVHRKGLNNTTSFQLFSDLGDRGANELNVSIQRSVDESTPAVTWPQMEADLISSIDGASFQRGVRVGSQFYAQNNDLRQTNIQFTNTLSLNKDPDEGTGTGSVYTLGLTGAYYDISHRYVPGETGSYFWASMRDVRNNAPQRYERTLLADGVDPTTNFSVLQWGAFVQDQIDAGKGLTMRFGLRIDVPWVLDHPDENFQVTDLFDYKTSKLPSGQFLLSPRWGFNWQSEGEHTTQVRGGLGMFVGQLPFVWLSNAFQYDGMSRTTMTCTGRVTDDPLSGNTVPPFDPFNPPNTCYAGEPNLLRTVTVFDPGFKYPQDLKFSVVVDHEFTSRISGSLGFLFNRAINQIVLQELNLGDPAGNQGPLDGYGGFERRRYGRANGTGFVPTWDHPEFGHVLLATNESEDWGYSITAEARGQLTDRLGFQTGYSYARSYDKMSLVSTDMVANYGLTPTRSDPNRAELTTSNFDRPHKLVLSVYGAPFPGLDDTQISLLYTGQSGLPFSYVYYGDINGDGYPGQGPAFDRTNDLIYVPEKASELPSGLATQALLGRALESDECLAASRGEVIPRNSCRSPWQNRLDVRLSQITHVGGAEVRLEADMINFLNLLNADWGSVQSVRANTSLIEPVGRRDCLGCVGALVSRWAGPALPSRDQEARLVPTEPWAVVSPDSQWQMQFGMRITFGGNR